MPARRATPSRPASPLGLKRGLSRVLVLVEREIDRAIEVPHAPPNLLRDLHRDLRRLAGGLSLWGELLSPRDASELKPVVRRIRRFARLVGRVRDRDVTLGLLDPLAPAQRRGEEAERLRGFLGRLREDGRTSRELLRAFLTSERRGGLLDQARGVLERPMRRGAREQILQIFQDEWHLHRRRVRRSHRRARKRPNANRLHRLRIQIRRWRHLATLADIAQIAPPEPVDTGLRALQDRLGRLHDLHIALVSLPEELSKSVSARRLETMLEEDRASIRTLLEGRPPRTRRLSSGARPRVRR